MCTAHMCTCCTLSFHCIIAKNERTYNIRKKKFEIHVLLYLFTSEVTCVLVDLEHN